MRYHIKLLIIAVMLFPVSVLAQTYYIPFLSSVDSFFSPFGNFASLCNGNYSDTYQGAVDACVAALPPSGSMVLDGYLREFQNLEVKTGPSRLVSDIRSTRVGQNPGSWALAQQVGILSVSTLFCESGVPVRSSNSWVCGEPEPPSCEPGVESSFELEASEPASTTCHDGCEQVKGPVSVGFMGVWGVTYKTTGQTCTVPTPGLTAVSDPEGCFDANGINFCSSPSGAPDEQCGTFNGKLICSQGTAAGPADKPPPQGCITKGDVTACTSDAPNTAPPRPSTEQGGSTPTSPAGNMSGPAGSTDIHIGGFFGGSGDGDGNGGEGDGDGDECPEGQVCTGKVKVKQIKDGFGGEFKTAQDQRLTDLEQDLSDKLATVRNEMGALFGSLSESGGQLPDYSFSIPYPGGSIPVNWNLGSWNMHLNIIALAIMFLAVVIGISIILGD